MAAFFAAFQFLTIFPAVIRRPFTAKELGQAAAFYPLVGLALGGVLYGLYEGFTLVLPPLVSAALVVAAWLALTRALHFDGFIDTCDGLFGGWTPEKRLDIMRDSRAGAFAVAGGGILLIIKTTVVASLPAHGAGFVIVPVLGRWVMTGAVSLFPYARESGLGRDVKDNTGWAQLALATLFTAGAVYVLAGLTGFIIMGAATLLLAGGGWYVLRLIPGMTGDIYGALCELAEVTALLGVIIVTGLRG